MALAVSGMVRRVGDICRLCTQTAGMGDISQRPEGDFARTEGGATGISGIGGTSDRGSVRPGVGDTDGAATTGGATIELHVDAVGPAQEVPLPGTCGGSTEDADVIPGASAAVDEEVVIGGGKAPRERAEGDPAGESAGKAPRLPWPGSGESARLVAQSVLRLLCIMA